MAVKIPHIHCITHCRQQTKANLEITVDVAAAVHVFKGQQHCRSAKACSIFVEGDLYVEGSVACQAAALCCCGTQSYLPPKRCHTFARRTVKSSPPSEGSSRKCKLYIHHP